MRLERVVYRKMFSFEGGNLDLRAIPPGLVALTGPNWSGKTTFLELILAALYRETASRATVDIAPFASARDSWVEAEFSVDGLGAFRARVNIDGVARPRKVQAVLEQIQPDGRRVPLNDGKVSTFDEAVQRIAPRKDGLLCSAFAAQNRAGSLTSVPKAKRKDLFIHFLWQERLVAMAETAKACLQVADRARVALETTRDTLVKETSPEIVEMLRQRNAALDAERQTLLQRRTRLQTEIATLEQERAALLEQAQAHVTAQARVTALTATIATRQAEVEQIACDAQAARTAATDDHARTDRRIGSTMADLDRRARAETEAHTRVVGALDTKIANNRRLRADAEAIRAAAAATAAAQETIRALREHESAARREEAAARAQVRGRERQLQEADQGVRDLATARESARLLTVVKFGEQCAVDPPCQFVAQAATAKASIPALEGVAAQVDATRDALAEWTAQLTAVDDRIRSLLAHIAAAEQQMVDHAPQTALAAHLDLAEHRIAEYVHQREEADAQYEARSADVAQQWEAAQRDAQAAHADSNARLAARLTELASRTTAAQLAIAAAEQEQVAALEEAARTRTASARVDLLEVELGTRRQQGTDTEAALATVTVRQDEVTRAGEAIARRLREREAVERRLTDVQTAWRVHALLAKALHRDGLPTLEIAAAGPAVSQLCTDLLEHSGFGTRFTVEVVTQVATADGKGLKEDFAVLVYDNERGGEPRDIGDLSGGERIVVEEGLRAAMAIYVNARHAHPVRTCWRDETTGPLDAENRRRYVAMLRRLRELGGFDHVLYISHADDAVDQADTVIDVSNGGATVRCAA
jgi:exonuclease SbcC